MPSPVYGTPRYASAVQETVRQAHGVVQAVSYDGPLSGVWRGERQKRPSSPVMW